VGSVEGMTEFVKRSSIMLRQSGLQKRVADGCVVARSDGPDTRHLLRYADYTPAERCDSSRCGVTEDLFGYLTWRERLSVATPPSPDDSELFRFSRGVEMGWSSADLRVACKPLDYAGLSYDVLASATRMIIRQNASMSRTGFVTTSVNPACMARSR
jgi:hypothetical protein